MKVPLYIFLIVSFGLFNMYGKIYRPYTYIEWFLLFPYAITVTFLTDSFKESVSTIFEKKVRGWLGGIIDDMRRSSPVQQWLDSLPTQSNSEIVNPDEDQAEPTDKSDSKPDDTTTENTVVETIKLKLQEEINLDVPGPKDTWKRKSLDSAMLTSTPHRGSVKRLQRDHSVQSEGYSPKLKNPLFRDHSLQVMILFSCLWSHFNLP